MGLLACEGAGADVGPGAVAAANRNGVLVGGEEEAENLADYGDLGERKGGGKERREVRESWGDSWASPAMFSLLFLSPFSFSLPPHLFFSFSLFLFFSHLRRKGDHSHRQVGLQRRLDQPVKHRPHVPAELLRRSWPGAPRVDGEDGQVEVEGEEVYGGGEEVGDGGGAGGG